jgi:hypothetical protein
MSVERGESQVSVSNSTNTISMVWSKAVVIGDSTTKCLVWMGRALDGWNERDSHAHVTTCFVLASRSIVIQNESRQTSLKLTISHL